MARNNKTAKNTAGEIGRVRVLEDFLPAPEALVPREEKVKVQSDAAKNVHPVSQKT